MKMTFENDSDRRRANGSIGAVFDLDGTLLPDTSAEIAFIKFALRTGELSLGAFGSRFLRWVLAIPFRGRTRNKSHFEGLSVAELSRMGRRFCLEELVNRIPERAVRAIDDHREREERVGIISGAPDLLIQSLGDLLGLDFVLGTRLERQDGVLTGRVAGEHLSGARKVVAVESVAQQFALDLTQSFAYGNAYADRFLLSQVSCPVAVNPDSRLRRFARKQGWPVRSYG
jgi:HAD superfamily hydrolase (TIGR01490 family)